MHKSNLSGQENYARFMLINKFSLKGLGHAILGNFSTDQMVIELT